MKKVFSKLGYQVYQKSLIGMDEANEKYVIKFQEKLNNNNIACILHVEPVFALFHVPCVDYD